MFTDNNYKILNNKYKKFDIITNARRTNNFYMPDIPNEMAFKNGDYSMVYDDNWCILIKKENDKLYILKEFKENN